MTFTVSTWNVENLSSSARHYREKLDFISERIRKADPDVIALQELLDKQVIVDLASCLQGYSFINGKRDPRGIRVGFLTRLPLVGKPRVIQKWRLNAGDTVVSFDKSGAAVAEKSMPRPALCIRVSTGFGEVAIFNAHLKSKLLTFGRTRRGQTRFTTADESLRARTGRYAVDRRSAEAVTLREHATDLLKKGRHVIVIGDLNDGADAATTKILYGPPGSQPDGTRRDLEPRSGFQMSDKGDDQRLFNITMLVPDSDRWTREQDRRRELLDHVLASFGLLPRSAADGLRHLPQVLIFNTALPSLSGPKPRSGDVAPDHALVVATFPDA